MRRIGFLLALVLSVLTACKQGASIGDKPKAEAASDRKVYKARGVVKGFPSPSTVKISHDEIRGYMAAMTMVLSVRNTNELSTVKVGEIVTFDLVVTSDDGWIENVKSLGFAPVTPQETNNTPHFRRVRDVEPLSVGELMPDYPFVTEDGKSIRLSNFKGQAVAFTFFFTRCPFPTFCPRMMTNFEKAAKALSTPDGPTNWHFLSITFDVETDTPEQLKKYAGRYERDASKWDFVTSEMVEIDALTEQFGVVFAKRNGTIDHNLRTVIVDANNKIQQIYVGNEWSVDEFVADMKKAALAHN